MLTLHIGDLDLILGITYGLLNSQEWALSTAVYDPQTPNHRPASGAHMLA